MNTTSYVYFFCALFLFSFCFDIHAQVYEFSSEEKGKHYQHRIFKDDNYFIETIFGSNPPEFVLTRGGFYTTEENHISVTFEFNSNFEQDELKQQNYSPDARWKNISKEERPLQGKWLMGGRVTDTGEQRRDLSSARKTMKILYQGYFQWTAFNTESLAFFGAGGGTYTAANGTYEEHLDYFSRDNSRVGAKLPFSYAQKENDWYHKGLSSKGNPFHEIWTARPRQ